MRSLCFSVAFAAAFGCCVAPLSAQVNPVLPQGQNVVGPVDQLPAGVLPWYMATRGRRGNNGPVNPLAQMQAQQQAAAQAMMQQQAAVMAAKAQEKARKKEQQNAVNSRKRAAELSERKSGDGKP